MAQQQCLHEHRLQLQCHVSQQVLHAHKLQRQCLHEHRSQQLCHESLEVHHGHMVQPQSHCEHMGQPQSRRPHLVELELQKLHRPGKCSTEVSFCFDGISCNN